VANYVSTPGLYHVIQTNDITMTANPPKDAKLYHIRSIITPLPHSSSSSRAAGGTGPDVFFANQLHPYPSSTVRDDVMLRRHLIRRPRNRICPQRISHHPQSKINLANRAESLEDSAGSSSFVMSGRESLGRGGPSVVKLKEGLQGWCFYLSSLATDSS